VKARKKVVKTEQIESLKMAGAVKAIGMPAGRKAGSVPLNGRCPTVPRSPEPLPEKSEQLLVPFQKEIKVELRRLWKETLRPPIDYEYWISVLVACARGPERLLVLLKPMQNIPINWGPMRLIEYLVRITTADKGLVISSRGS